MPETRNNSLESARQELAAQANEYFATGKLTQEEANRLAELLFIEPKDGLSPGDQFKKQKLLDKLSVGQEPLDKAA